VDNADESWQVRRVEHATRPSLEDWVDWLFERHQRDLTFQELRRSLQALSGAYVERRDLHAAPKALDGKGKRAAFACFFAPLHFVVVREILASLERAHPITEVVDLGCGTLGAGLAWATSLAGRTPVGGVDVNRWAVDEARHSAEFFGVVSRVQVGDLVEARLPVGSPGIVLAYAVNELAIAERARLLARLLAAAAQGARVLVVEPIARTLTAAWWPGWEEAFGRAGGNAEAWRFQVDLPRRLQELDRAAGLDHRQLKARSLWLAGPGDNVG
jgi:hypothetical protein